MVISNRPKTGYEKWQETIDTALHDVRWHEYDCSIVSIVNEFNRHLAPTPQYHPLNWRIVKAMIWTETGGPTDPSWRSRPMHIGHPSDPGLHALFGGKEGGDLIMPPDMKRVLSVANAIGMPIPNIKAGTGYLLMRFARYGFESVADRDSRLYDITVRPGDSLDRIARANGTTRETLEKLNPGVRLLRPGQVLQFRRAAIRKVIVGWNPLSTSLIASRYNTRDPRYADKLNYCLSIMSRREESKCAT